MESFPQQKFHRLHHNKNPSKSKFDFPAAVSYNSPMHKIAFSGISGSGKTSVLAEVKKMLSLKYRVEEVPDLKPNTPFDFDLRPGFVSQFFFITSQINEENIHAQSHPDFLLCDGWLLDYWLEWQRTLQDHPHNEPGSVKQTMLENLYRFWLPTYTMAFRIRADAKIVKKRKSKKGLREYPTERCQQLDEQYQQAVQQDRVHSFDIWNHRSIDEGAQEVMVHLTETKLI
jgi:hypothetical protein